MNLIALNNHFSGFFFSKGACIIIKVQNGDKGLGLFAKI